MPLDKENRRLYVDYANGYGISLIDVANCLRDYRRDKDGNINLGTMCTSEKINIWSKYKPVEFNSPLELSKEDWEAANYGLAVSSMFSSTAESLISKAISSECKYEYIRPSTWARLTDFEGYNGLAETPYKFTLQNDKSRADGWVDVYVSDKADLKLSDLNFTDISNQDINSMNLVLLTRPKNATSGVLLHWALTADEKHITLGDIETASATGGAAPIARFNIPSGEHYLVAALTDASVNDTEDKAWVFLPEAFFSVQYDPAYTRFIWYYSDTYGEYSVAAKKSTGAVIFDTTTKVDLVSVNTAVTMESNATEGITGKITLEIGGGTTDEDMQTEPVQSFTILAGQSAELSFNIKDISTRIEEPYVQSIYIRAKIWYKDINAADTSAKYIYFDFLKGEQTAVVQPPVSIKAINDSMGW
jgi:hypothetical protein